MPELLRGAGDGQLAVIVARAVGSDGAGDGHIRGVHIARAASDERQVKGRLAGGCVAAQLHRGGEGHVQGDELVINGVERHIRVRGIDTAKLIEYAVRAHPAGVDEALAVEALSGQGQIHAVGLDVHPEAEIGAAVIGDGVFRLCAAGADAVHEDVLLQNLDGLGRGRGLSVRRRAVHRQLKGVRIAIVRGRYRAIADTAVGPVPARIAAVFSASIVEIRDFRALRRRGGELIALLRADHIRAADRERRRRRRAEVAAYYDRTRHAVAGCQVTNLRRFAVHGDSRRYRQTFVVQIDRTQIARASFKHFGVTHWQPFFDISAIIFPTASIRQNIFFAEGDVQARGGKAVGDVGRCFAHLEVVDRDGEGRRHRRAEVADYPDRIRHVVVVRNPAESRCDAVHGGGRRQLQTLVVQRDIKLIACASFEHIGAPH